MTLQNLPQRKMFSMHTLYGALFVVIGVVSLVILAMVVSQADTTTQSVDVTNTAPTVDSVTISQTTYGSTWASIALTENTTTNVYVWGAVSDTNGCDEIDTVSQYALKLFRTDKTYSCTADNNDCYSLTSATAVDSCTAGGSDTSARFAFTVPMQYFADPTDTGAPQAATTWTARVVVTDDGALTGDASSSTSEVSSLISLDVTSSVAYGSLALGATSASDQTVTITNTGNRNMDANVKADGNMTCTTVGAITVGQVKYSLSGGFTYASAGTAMTTSDASVNNSTAQQTSESVPSTTPLYFKIQIPATGVAGTCSNILTFTAIADV